MNRSRTNTTIGCSTWLPSHSGSTPMTPSGVRVLLEYRNAVLCSAQKRIEKKNLINGLTCNCSTGASLVIAIAQPTKRRTDVTKKNREDGFFLLFRLFFCWCVCGSTRIFPRRTKSCFIKLMDEALCLFSFFCPIFFYDAYVTDRPSRSL